MWRSVSASWSAACSMRLRITYSFRSNRSGSACSDGLPGASPPYPTNSCSTTGIVAAADAPSTCVRGRHRPPAEERLAFLADDLLDERPDLCPFAVVARQEDVADAVLAGRRQADAEGVGHLAEEPIGRLDQDAGAVTRVGLAAARARGAGG